MPRVSVIIPVYRVEEYLRQCVDSVLAQSFNDFELILIDDGSPDACPSICDQYAVQDSRVKVIHKKNEGVSSARNDGLKAASGEYIIFIDSDDYWNDEDGLQRLVKSASVNKSEVVIFGYQKYLEKKNLYSSGPRIREADIVGKPFLVAIHYLIANRFFMISACNKLIKKNVLIDNNIWFEPERAGEDLDWSLKLSFFLHSVAAVDSNFYIYRSRSNSVTNTKKENNATDWLATIATWHDFLLSQQSQPDRIEHCYLLLSDAYLSMIFLYTYLSKRNKKKLGLKIKSHSSLLRYSGNQRVRIVRYLYYLCGLRVSARILKLYVNRTST